MTGAAGIAGSDGIAAEVSRWLAAAGNVIEYARFGGLDTGEEPSPFDVVAHGTTHRLRRYYPGECDGKPPVLLVPPLMLAADVWDVSPATSAVALLRSLGLDPWVVDFGDPGREVGGARRNVTDHVLTLSDAIDQVAEQTGRDVHIGGYSQGGLFCYQAAALRRCNRIAGIFALGSPLRPLSVPGVDLPEDLVDELQDLWTWVLRRTGLPGWAAANLFTWTSPVSALTSRVQYLAALRDRQSVLPRERQRKFLARDGWITFPGPAIAEVMESMSNERFVRGGLVFGDRTVTLADVTCPILIFTGTGDGFAPAPAVRDIVRAAPRADVYEQSVPSGHFGLGVGSKARSITWPTVGEWVRWLEGAGELPDSVERVESAPGASDRATGTPLPGATAAAWSTAKLVLDVGRSLPGIAGGVSAQLTESAREIARVAVAQLPRLARMERVGPHTRMSYALMVEEACAERPAAAALLIDDRVYTHADVAERVDGLTARLLTVGVRRGEHVGVRLASAVEQLVVVAALNRIGAVAVLLRPDGDHVQECRAGRVARILTDPDTEPASTPRDLAVPFVVLGRSVGTGSAHGAADVIDLDEPSPDHPPWFVANPGLGGDLAFVLFTGSGADVRTQPVTNRRWALSAFGAASAAELDPSDTVFSASPIHHASGLLLATAAAVVGGARLALAREFRPERFWSDVRRYGATVVPYTWAMLAMLLREPVVPEERHHPVRLFVGSGIPRSVWHGVVQRFAPAQVLEMFAVARTHSILANVSGRKIGAVGRPLPGTARVELVAVGSDGNPLLDAAGHAVPTGPDEVGMLVTELDQDVPVWEEVPNRGLFATDDAWISSGELFRRDRDGDLWPIGRWTDAVPTPTGLATPRLAEDAAGEIPGVELAVCGPDRTGTTVLVIACRSGSSITTASLTTALDPLPPEARPGVVRVVDEIPLTTWYRPDAALAVTEGRASRSWRRDTRGRLRPAPALRKTGSGSGSGSGRA